VFEQRRRAELYAKHSEAQGNPSLKIFRTNTGASFAYHKEGERNRRKVSVSRANAEASSAYHKENEKNRHEMSVLRTDEGANFAIRDFQFIKKVKAPSVLLA